VAVPVNPSDDDDTTADPVLGGSLIDRGVDVFGLRPAQREVAGHYVRYALDAGYGCDRGERE
jgi:hypothetical protein